MYFCFGSHIGGGRSFKVGGQEWESGTVPQWGPGAKLCLLELTTLLCENVSWF